jgi:hypothetical protein
MSGSGSDDAFYRWGFYWIQLKSCWYGLFAVVFGASIDSYVTRNQKLLNIFLVGIVTMFLADSVGVHRDETIVDRLIAATGYVVAITVFPYHAEDNLIPASVSPAISPNTTVTATTPRGNIVITSGNGLLRTIVWDGQSSTISLTPNTGIDKKGKFDSFTFPDPSEKYRHKYTFNRRFWNLHQGVSKCYYSEKRKYFNSQNEAFEYIGMLRGAAPGVYNNHGLFIGWNKHDDAIEVIVLQVVINGKEPKIFLGAEDSKIEIAEK